VKTQYGDEYLDEEFSSSAAASLRSSLEVMS
jgi:hypothetical protein